MVVGLWGRWKGGKILMEVGIYFIVEVLCDVMLCCS